MQQKHGSFQNLIRSNVVGCPVPVVGMGVTEIHWTDREAGTITRVSESGKTFWYKLDDYKRIDKLGMTDSGQQYVFTPNPNAPERKATLRKNGSWKSGGMSLIIGQRERYYDFTF